ncbi:MarR family winged helix-turn-helix transcriptional regulator [Methanosarcina sp. MTP4]|uniref:MarR family winged helix-turn-helix transcriptional regulator n=1 Tax=Methanosarcina sp. MTP4 TaxID=1434100 RepID=UPI0021019597|nr:MarR family transcriptional regulator [Methanosarcina sp. MTP4]
MGSGQFSFMMSLLKKEGVRQEDLARKYKMDKATAARATKKLESTGYAYRQQDPGDKRAYRVFVTKKGRSLEEKMMKIALKWDTTVFSGFSKEEKQLQTAFLERMEQNVSGIYE